MTFFKACIYAKPIINTSTSNTHVNLARQQLQKVCIARVGPAGNIGGMIVEVGVTLLVLVLQPT
jgi:hypothetical protein